MENKPLLTYFGHHKCGTQWFKAIITDVSALLKIKYVSHHNASQFDKDLPKFVEGNQMDFYSFINAQWKFIKDLKNHKGFHVIRDPRDIVVSGYYSHLYSHSTQAWTQLVEIRDKLQTSSKEDGLMSEIERSTNLINHISSWDYSNPNIMELKMEEFMGNPYERLIDVFKFLDLVYDKESPQNLKNNDRLPIGKFMAAAYYNRFSAKAKGRTEGQEDQKSHYRKGVAGDWKNHFTENHKKAFKDIAGQVLIELGYEKNMDW